MPRSLTQLSCGGWACRVFCGVLRWAWAHTCPLSALHSLTARVYTSKTGGLDLCLGLCKHDYAIIY